MPRTTRSVTSRAIYCGAENVREQAIVNRVTGSVANVPGGASQKDVSKL
jgi:hypothetical protein